jgi:hypothetical protein
LFLLHFHFRLHAGRYRTIIIQMMIIPLASIPFPVAHSHRELAELTIYGSLLALISFGSRKSHYQMQQHSRECSNTAESAATQQRVQLHSRECSYTAESAAANATNRITSSLCNLYSIYRFFSSTRLVCSLARLDLTSNTHP